MPRATPNQNPRKQQRGVESRLVEPSAETRVFRCGRVEVPLAPGLDSGGGNSAEGPLPWQAQRYSCF